MEWIYLISLFWKIKKIHYPRIFCHYRNSLKKNGTEEYTSLWGGDQLVWRNKLETLKQDDADAAEVKKIKIYSINVNKYWPYINSTSLPNVEKN